MNKQTATWIAAWALAATVLVPGTALALSEIPEEQAPPEAPVTSVPLPPPISNPANPAGEAPAATGEQEEAEPQEETTSGPVPEVLRDLALLPEPVRLLRQRIIEACERGDIDALRPLLSVDDDKTVLSLGEVDGDPVAFLKSLSGDGEGHEILAILQEVLEAGFVHLEANTDAEIYVWPYFFAVPMDKLTAPQRVELFRLVTAGDYEDMKSYGGYIFYRVGITPQGKWAFFVAGD